MIFFTVKSQVANLGKRKGQVLYYAQQQTANRITLRQVEEEVVQRTSLSRGDVRSAIASLTEVVNAALLRGDSVDLGDLGNLRVAVSGKRVDKKEEVTARTLNTPRIVYTPKTEMKAQAQKVSLSVDNASRTAGTASTTLGGGGSTSSSGGSSGTGSSSPSEDQGL